MTDNFNDPTDIFKLTEEANRLANKTAIVADVGGFIRREDRDPKYAYVGLGFIMAMGPEHSHLVLRDLKTILTLARENNLPIINPQEPDLAEELNDIAKNTIEYNKYMEADWLWQLETIEFINYFKNHKKSPWGMSSMGGKEEFVNKYYRELGLDSPERPDRKPNYPAVAPPAVEPSQVSPAVSDFDKWTLNSMGIKENKHIIGRINESYSGMTDPTDFSNPIIEAVTHANPPSKCDVCKVKIGKTFYDASLKGMGWANVCPSCFKMHGKGLGTGLGQKYTKNEEGKYVKEVQAPKNP